MKATRFLPLIGISLFALILYNIRIGDVLANFRNLNWPYFLIAILILLPSLALKSVKWNYLLKPYGFKFGLLEGMKIWVIGFAIGLLTPAKIGDFAKAFYLKARSRIGVGKSLTSVVLERVFDVGVLLFCGLISLTFLGKLYGLGTDFIATVLVLFLLFGLGCLLFFKKKVLTGLMRPLFKFFIPEKHKPAARKYFDEFYEGVRIAWGKKSILLVVVILTGLSWALSFLTAYFLALALNLNVSPWFIFLIMPLVLLVEILPISFSGLGTRDATMILFFTLVGLSREAAVSFSLLMLITNYVFGLPGFLFWLKDPLPLGEGKL